MLVPISEMYEDIEDWLILVGEEVEHQAVGTDGKTEYQMRRIHRALETILEAWTRFPTIFPPKIPSRFPLRNSP